MFNLFGEHILPTDDGRSTGCENCNLNYVAGLKKVKGLDRIQGRRCVVWAQSPGAREQEKGLELVGPSGQLIWEEFALHGVTRGMVDVQNVVRCRPLDETGLEHPPTKRELRCCSVHNEEALEKMYGKAAVHIIFGEVAGKQLLKKRYKKDNPFFWHEGWNAYVILAPHPSYILRMGYPQNKPWAYYDFKERVKGAVACMQQPTLQRWAYVAAQDYGAVHGEQQVLALERRLIKEAEAGRRISVDIEDGHIDGRRVILAVGFGWGQYKNENWDSWRGAARSVVVDHPGARCPEQRKGVVAVLKRILENSKIQKALQHGSYDVDKIKLLLGAELKGYDFDTQYAAYQFNSQLRKYGLERIVRYWFLEFMDYKLMVEPWKANMAEAPLDVLVKYNCGDCDLTKRCEARLGPKISQPLNYVYVQDAFVVDAMEEKGPLLDQQNWERLHTGIPPMMKELEHKLQVLAGDPNFNPGSPEQVAWLLYDKLHLPAVNEEQPRGTEEDILQALIQKTGARAPRLVLDWRTLHTLLATFVLGYKKSAEQHNGELRTIWWLTGAASGRLRSGKGEEAEREGLINMQNIPQQLLIKHMIVSDLNWREITAAIGALHD